MRCPICEKELKIVINNQHSKSYVCLNKHCFDISKSCTSNHEIMVVQKRKNRNQMIAVSLKRMPGSDLLSHKRTLHYHRRNCISLLCSEWEQVVLQHYGRQANWV